MTFSLSDIEQMAFFQLIYVVLLFYLTCKELSRKPATGLLWLIIAADMVYMFMLCWVAYQVYTFVPKSAIDHFKWFLFLLALFGPCIPILLAFSIYNIQKDRTMHNRQAE